ncbi:MAG: S8 family serine peptidase [Desulfosarcinaceae bacterium]|nr:S8 family serine peptidase [Desulfosarcinaceae bacterium]
MRNVIVEMKAPMGLTMDAAMAMPAAKMAGFTMDADFEPIPVEATKSVAAAMDATSEEVVLVRGVVDEKEEKKLKKQDNVVNVWSDARIEPFPEDVCDDANSVLREEGLADLLRKADLDFFEEMPVVEEGAEVPTAFDLELAAPCQPWDCQSTVAKGTIEDVARYLRCDRLWAKGIRGQGVTIGICDSGVNKTKVSACSGGWSPSSGYVPGNAPSTSHGTMCAFDAAGMAPDAEILDIAILQSSSGGISGLLSDAIRAYHWALGEYQRGRKPMILSNSWGMYQKAWAPDYATDANHPFTRKVVQLINAGILVTFAAGNCGSQCPSGRCGADSGPGRSIWGANGHPAVITVGAANILDHWIGYTSQGPAALDPQKPDFCAPSHFKGARSSDNGTSAANPVCAGVIALLKSHDPKLTQQAVKEALGETAKNLCAPGWDRNSGFGMIQAERAFNKLNFSPTIAHAMWVHGSSVEAEYPENLPIQVRKGYYTIFEGKAGTRNWFHYAIPTPVIVGNSRLRLDSVMVKFLAHPDVWITNVHIYDGYQKIKAYNGLSLTGNHLFERFDVLDRYVGFGIGISVGVRFGSDTSKRHFVRFLSAGADFIV